MSYKLTDAERAEEQRAVRREEMRMEQVAREMRQHSPVARRHGPKLDFAGTREKLRQGFLQWGLDETMAHLCATDIVDRIEHTEGHVQLGHRASVGAAQAMTGVASTNYGGGDGVQRIGKV